jgi:uncharacterized DUF497 family protein
MKLAFDPLKNRQNINKHGIDLADVEGVFYDQSAMTREDRDHDEARFAEPRERRVYEELP